MNLFSEHLNTLYGIDDSEIKRFIQDILFDLMLDATPLELSESSGANVRPRLHPY